MEGGKSIGYLPAIADGLPVNGPAVLEVRAQFAGPDNDAGGYWQGIWLTNAAAATGRNGFVVADDINVAARRDGQLDVMADLLDAHLDVDAVIGLLGGGTAPRPTIVAALH